MARRKITFTVGCDYHIYNKAVAENLLFIHKGNYKYFLERMWLFLIPVGDILAFCLMPNHYHILLKLKHTSLSTAMQKLALSYAVPYNNYYGRSGHLFQGRFQVKHVLDTQYLVHLSRYIHLNPKAVNLVNNAEDWEYSSLLDYYGTRVYPMVKTDVILDILADTVKMNRQEKQQRYRNFIDAWDPDYMAFRLK